MNLRGRSLTLFVFLAICFLVVRTPAPAQAPSEKSPGRAADALSSDAAALQKKASEAQARIRGNEDDSGQIKRAIKINEAALAKEVLLRNGFSAKDLENAKIKLRTGGGKGGQDQIEISVACCDPKEITIQRTLENPTK